MGKRKQKKIRDFLVGIQPIGAIDETYAKTVAAAFLGELNLSARILTPMEHPEYAFNEKRIQYDAGMIIKELESMYFSGNFSGIKKVIALIDVDLFIPVFSHVMGEARLGGKCALVFCFQIDGKQGKSG